MIHSLPELLEGLSMTLEEARVGGLKEKVAYIIQEENKRTPDGYGLQPFPPGGYAVEPHAVKFQLKGLFELVPTDQELLFAFVANVPDLLSITVAASDRPNRSTSFCFSTR